MDNQPPFNRDLIIPIVIGGISVVGIIIALLVGRWLNSPPTAPMTPSATPFQYLFLGTEPAITTPLVEGSEVAAPTEDAFPGLLSPTSPFLATPSTSTPALFPPGLGTSTTTALVLRTNTPGGGLPTATSGTAAGSNTYDDTSPQLVYTGNWVTQSNVSGAYQGTLHVSNTLGDTVTFTFTGREIHLFYQAGPSLGSIAITIDNVGPPPLSQEQNETQIKEWVYNLDTAGTHSIVIQHFGGGSVNIDSISVPSTTPTSTATPTPTPTQ